MKGKLRGMKGDSKSLNIGLIGVPGGYRDNRDVGLEEITMENFTELK